MFAAGICGFANSSTRGTGRPRERAPAATSSCASDSSRHGRARPPFCTMLRMRCSFSAENSGFRHSSKTDGRSSSAMRASSRICEWLNRVSAIFPTVPASSPSRKALQMAKACQSVKASPIRSSAARIWLPAGTDSSIPLSWETCFSDRKLTGSAASGSTSSNVRSWPSMQ